MNPQAGESVFRTRITGIPDVVVIADRESLLAEVIVLKGNDHD